MQCIRSKKEMHLDKMYLAAIFNVTVYHEGTSHSLVTLRINYWERWLFEAYIGNAPMIFELFHYFFVIFTIYHCYSNRILTIFERGAYFARLIPGELKKMSGV